MKQERFQPLDLLSVPLEGTNLVEASAGTGKTYTIANLYLRLVLEKDLEPKQILVVTFTEAATKELRERIRKILALALEALQSRAKNSEDALLQLLEKFEKKLSPAKIASRLRRALVCFDEASIFTIHGFCRRLLSDFSFESNMPFDMELVQQQDEFVDEIVDDFQRLVLTENPPVVTQLVRDNGLDRKGLRRFASLLLRNPSMTIVPADVPDPMDSISGLQLSLVNEWQQSKDDVVRIMEEDKGLRRGQKHFHGDFINAAIEAFDGMTAEGLLPIDFLNRFSTSFINNALKKNAVAPSHRFFELCEQLQTLIRQLVVHLKIRFRHYLETEMEKRKTGRQVLSFDDLLTSVHKAVLSTEMDSPLVKTVRDSYQAALIDEFQDTDPIQFTIFHRLFSGYRTLFYIGDPKQAIYAFRGADVFTYLSATEQIDEDKRFTLQQNWRSETGLVEGVNTLFSNSDNPFALQEAIYFDHSRAAAKSKGETNPLKVDGDPPQNLYLWYLKNQNPDKSGANTFSKDLAAEAVVLPTVNEISRLLQLSMIGKASVGDRPLQPSDIAILVLKNEDAQMVKAHLSKLSIPAVVTQTGNVFETDEAKDLSLVLQAIANPSRVEAVNSALVTGMISFTAETIRTLIEDPDALEQYDHYFSLFHDYHDLWKKRGFVRMFRRLLDDFQVKKTMLQQAGGERRLTNTLHLSELIHQQEMEKGLGLNATLNWFTRQIESPELNEESEIRLEKDSEAVQISTVFKSKGLQYPIVFCPFMWQRNAEYRDTDLIYHDNGRLVLNMDWEKNDGGLKAKAEQERLSDLLRLLYVAVTRAQNRCYLLFGRIGRKPAGAMEYTLTGGQSGKSIDINEIARRITSRDDDELLEWIAQRYSDNHTTVLVKALETARKTDVQYKPDANPTTLKKPEYPGINRLAREWGIASYSKLTAYDAFVPADEGDATLLLDEGHLDAPRQAAVDMNSFFAFPGGRVSGTCIHSIFERLCFRGENSEKRNKQIIDALRRYGLLTTGENEEMQGLQVRRVDEMLRRVLSTPLVAEHDTFCLNQIDESQKQVEFEFYYPLHRLTPANLTELFKKANCSHYLGSGAVPNQTGRLNFRPIEGFMHGFIDLVVEHSNRYYLLDWKTNNLGGTFEDYHPAKIDRSIHQELYTLQYCIYSLALDRFLASRLNDYAYETHFGGVFYLFVRGMHPEKAGYGLFYDKPPVSLINQLKTMICR